MRHSRAVPLDVPWPIKHPAMARNILAVCARPVIVASLSSHVPTDCSPRDGSTDVHAPCRASCPEETIACRHLAGHSIWGLNLRSAPTTCTLVPITLLTCIVEQFHSPINGAAGEPVGTSDWLATRASSPMWPAPRSTWIEQLYLAECGRGYEHGSEKTAGYAHQQGKRSRRPAQKD